MSCHEALTRYPHLALVSSWESSPINYFTNELWLSPISIWETLILAEKGRLTLEPTPEKWIEKSLQELDTTEAIITNEIAILSRQLELIHQDPADRFIAATAVHYGLTLATVDANLTQATCLNTLS